MRGPSSAQVDGGEPDRADLASERRCPAPGRESHAHRIRGPEALPGGAIRTGKGGKPVILEPPYDERGVEAQQFLEPAPGVLQPGLMEDLQVVRSAPVESLGVRLPDPRGLSATCD